MEKKEKEKKEKKEKKKKKDVVKRISLFRTVKFFTQFTLIELLGEGGLGIVYSGVRKTDGKKVAIKFACKIKDSEPITHPSYTCILPTEVALMELVSNQCPHIIELLEWFDAPNFYVLILELPESYIDLFDYCKNNRVPDIEAQFIIYQIADAASHCLKQGVFHRDIKQENILINPDTSHVKLIDFGCGDLLKESYDEYSGTLLFAPPEVHNGNCYQAESTTIWSLGILLYSLLCGCVPYRNKFEICKGNLYLPDYLSESCNRLLLWCLKPDPEERLTLQQFLSHDWFEDQVLCGTASALDSAPCSEEQP